MPQLDLRPRSATELVDITVQVMRQHYSLLVAGAATFVVPGLLLELLLPAPFVVLGTIVSNLFYAYASAMIIYIAAQLVLGRAVTVGEALAAIGRRAGSVLRAWCIQGFLVGFGLLLLIVPGLIWFAQSFAMQPAVILEGKSGPESWKRSKALAQGSIRRILGALGLGYVVFWVIFFGGSFLLGALAGPAGLGPRGVNAIQRLLLILAMPLVGVLTTLLYYDLRIRREGFDVDVMASALESAAGVAVPALPAAQAGQGVRS